MRKLSYILAILIVILFSSCPATPPSIPPSGLKPHRAPDIPQNVKVTSGLRDKLIVSWDAVENADSYRVFYVDAGNPSGKEMPLTANAVTGTSVSVDLTSNYKADLSSGTSYYFYVTAYRAIDGELLVSSPSLYVEGAIAPHGEDIFYHGYITKTMINLYWNCSTLFSVDDPERMLYGADFSIEYRIKGENSWIPIDRKTGNETDGPWLNEVLNLNRWPQNTTLEFQIKAEITASDGSKSQVTSNTLEVLVSNDKTPSAVENVTYTKGDSVDGITISWNIPEWTGILEPGGANSYFKIERAESGSSDFETLVDEISSAVHDEKISRSSDGICSFVDNDVDVGKRYIYRIVNAAKEEGLMYVQNEEEYYLSGEAYLFDDPEVTYAIATINKVNSASANITFTWNYGEKYDLEWKIERTVTHSNDTIAPTVSLLDLSINDSESGCSASFTETVSCFSCEDSRHEYSYRLTLMRKDGEAYWKSGTDFTLTSDNGATIADNKLELKTEPIIENLQVTERLGKIELKWEIIELETPVSNISYKYVIDEKESDVTDVNLNSDGTYGLILSFSDVESHDISLIAEAEGGYRTVLTAKASALGFNPELFVMATNSDENDNTISIIVNNLDIAYPEREVFEIEYKEGISGNWTPSGIFVSSENGQYEISLEQSKDYLFRISLSDKEYDDGPLYSSETSYMKVTGVSATKGEIGQINLSWNAVDNASGYEIYRYEEGKEVSAYNQIGFSTETSYIDNKAEPGNKYYYLVKAKRGEYSTGYSIEPSQAVENQFAKAEEGNLGYVYNTNAVAFTVEESFASETKLNPYFVIKFKMDETNSIYKLIAAHDNEGFTVDLNGLTTRDGNIWTNGLSNTEKGYVSLNTDTLEATVNADIGVIEDMENYTISNFSLQAWRETNSPDTTAVSSINEPHYKALGVYDYLYIVNTALSQELTTANSSEHFNGDWWGTTDYNGDSKTYNGNGIVIISCYSSGWSSKMNPGSIDLKEYKTYGLTLNTENVISVMSIEQGILEGGYQGDDPLSRIGNDSNNRTASITVEKTNIIGDKTISYDGASISYNDVYVDGSAGTYTVTIGGVAYNPIEQGDAKLIKKVELN